MVQTGENAMSATRSTSTVWRHHDHFEPDQNLDPQAQRRLRGHLEQIDYIAYAANREVVGGAMKEVDATAFQKLAVAAAQARARWVTAALAASDDAAPMTQAQLDQLAEVRRAFQELSDAYEGLRRLVERGYLTYAAR
jgi:hypothetical protein